VLAARKGGSPIPGALACGATPGELMRAIKAICAPPRLQPAESTVLIVLRDSSEPLPVEQICAAGGIARPAATQALAGLHAQGLALPQCDGLQRAWMRGPVTAAGRSESATGHDSVRQCTRAPAAEASQGQAG